MDEPTVAIPVNFTDAGRLFGMFEIRNTVEAVFLCVPLAALLMRILPIPMLARITVTSVVIVVVGGFALIGIGDTSLLHFLRLYIRFRKNRKILTYRGKNNAASGFKVGRFRRSEKADK